MRGGTAHSSEDSPPLAPGMAQVPPAWPPAPRAAGCGPEVSGPPGWVPLAPESPTAGGPARLSGYWRSGYWGPDTSAVARLPEFLSPVSGPPAPADQAEA